MNAEIGIRRGRKFEQVLDGARDVFLRDGFEGAKVDDIARAAQVSKATLYSYFPDKRRLFSEMVARELQLMKDSALQQIDFSQPPSVLLPLAARVILQFMSSPTSVKIFRITVAEAERFPEIGQGFYASGPAVMECTLCDYLRLAASRQELVIEDFTLAAMQFAELCKAEIWIKLVMGVVSQPSDDDISRIADGAAATFMARYGAT